MSSGPRIVVVGGVATDYLVRGPSLPTPGENANGGFFQEALGGKGANAAVAAVRLGAEATLVARVGTDRRGLEQLAWLEREGVSLASVMSETEAPSGAVLVMVDAHGRKQTFAALGANHRLSIRDVLRSVDRIVAAKVLLVQLEVPLDAVQAAVRLARAAGVKVVLDPAPARPLPEVLLEDVHVIRPNAREARTLTGIKVHDRASARRAARNLLMRGVGAAIIAAPGGSLLVSHEEEAWLPELPVDSVDTTGAGDAFSAALAVALAENQPLLTATRFAQAAAAIATTRVGAQAGLPYRDEVMGLLSDVGLDVRPAPP